MEEWQDPWILTLTRATIWVLELTVNRILPCSGVMWKWPLGSVSHHWSDLRAGGTRDTHGKEVAGGRADWLSGKLTAPSLEPHLSGDIRQLNPSWSPGQVLRCHVWLSPGTGLRNHGSSGQHPPPPDGPCL